MPKLSETLRSWLIEHQREDLPPLEHLRTIFDSCDNDLDGTYVHDGGSEETVHVSCYPALAHCDEDDYNWTLFLPAGPWVGSGLRLEGSVLVVPAEEDAFLSNWALLREEPIYRIRPFTEVSLIGLGNPEWQSYPFHFDGPSYDGMRENLLEGTGEWCYHVNNDVESLDASKLSFRYDDPFEGGFPAGEILEIVADDPHPDRYEYELTVTAHDAGGVSMYQDGTYEVYVGRVASTTPLGELIEQNVPTFRPTQPVIVTSELLDRTQLVDVVRWLETTATRLDADECRISCRDFDGTLAEFRREMAAEAPAVLTQTRPG